MCTGFLYVQPHTVPGRNRVTLSPAQLQGDLFAVLVGLGGIFEKQGRIQYGLLVIRNRLALAVSLT